jgi:hypothetical protein
MLALNPNSSLNSQRLYLSFFFYSGELGPMIHVTYKACPHTTAPHHNQAFQNFPNAIQRSSPSHFGLCLSAAPSFSTPEGPYSSSNAQLKHSPLSAPLAGFSSATVHTARWSTGKQVQAGPASYPLSRQIHSMWQVSQTHGKVELGTWNEASSRFWVKGFPPPTFPIAKGCPGISPSQ